MGSPAVKRIEDVRLLRAAQFPEDAGPLAHPIRPDSYQEISNFYTATIYNKGAEIIRMMRSEEHTSELQSLMRISYAVFCLKKKTKITHTKHTTIPKLHI